MPVPASDIVCRFIRQEDWSGPLGKPKNKLMKGPDISVWHEATLQLQGANLNLLQFESLAGSGQLNLSVADYLDIAAEVSRRIGCSFQIQIEWRTDDQFVKEPWRPWRDAHAQVEMIGTSLPHFPPAFRDLVIIAAKRKGSIVPPDAV